MPCYNNTKEGHTNLGNLFSKQKSPPTRNRPISPKPIAPNKVRAIGGQSAPPSLKRSLLAQRGLHRWDYRGAVRPPFIEAGLEGIADESGSELSGGSPPPLH